MNGRNPISLFVVALLLFGGCAANRAYNRGQEYARAQEWDQAVIYYQKALLEDPSKIEYRKALEIARVKASQHHLALAKAWTSAGLLERAEVEYRLALELDPTNQFASDSLAKLIEQRKQEAAQASQAQRGKSELETLKEETRGAGIPLLRPDSTKPITLNFPPDTKVKDIYTSLGKAAGINVLFDSGIQDRETFAIDIAGVPFQRALDQIVLANRHFYTVVDEQTLFLAPDTPQKRRDYEEQVIKTFYLSNSAPADMVNTLRGLLDTRRIVPNQALNAITIRDTPGKLAVIERIVEANDKPPAEVVIDVEIHEANRSSMLSLGTDLSSFTVTQGVDQTDTISGSSGDIRGLRLSNIPHLNQSDWLLTLPDLFYTARKSNGVIRTLARPSLRVADGKQVTLRLGDQVPIETSTFVGAGGTVGTNVARNFQFRDIGTNIDITPRVHHNNEVTLQLQVEVTSAGTDPDGPAGPVPPTFGNRRINTEIRLRDGETNLLAGLFTSSENSSTSGLPGVIDVPILKNIFGNNSRDRRETDIIVTLTPHIVRTPNINRRDLEAFYVGTETNVHARTDIDTGPSPFRRARGATDEAEGSEAAAGAAPAPPPLVRPQPDTDLGDPGNFGSPASPAGTDDRPEPPIPPIDSGADAAATDDRSSARPLDNAAVAVVSFRPPALSISADQTFSLDLLIENAVGVGHVPFWITFNKEIVEILGVEEGDFLNQDGHPTTFLHNVLGTGRLIVGLARRGTAPGVSGSGRLVTLKLRSLRPGTTALGFVNNAVRDPINKTIPSSFIPATITVEP